MLGKIAAILLLLQLSFAQNASLDNEKIVQTANGLIRGQHEITEREKVDFYTFRGIPYAKPPLGDLRFKVNQTKIIAVHGDCGCFYQTRPNFV